jgi:hypothetical protein
MAEEDLDALKREISGQWLGRDGVVAVGVGEEAGRPVVIVTFDEDRPAVAQLRQQYAGQPVVVRSGEGEIRAF